MNHVTGINRSSIYSNMKYVELTLARPSVAANVPRVGDGRAVHSGVIAGAAATAEVDILHGVDAGNRQELETSVNKQRRLTCSGTATISAIPVQGLHTDDEESKTHQAQVLLLVRPSDTLQISCPMVQDMVLARQLRPASLALLSERLLWWL